MELPTPVDPNTANSGTRMSSHPESPYTRPIQVGSATIGGGHPFVLLAGPALVDGRGDPFAVAERLDTLTRELDVPFIFKSAAPGDLGPAEFAKCVSLLREIRSRFAIPVCVELRETGQVAKGAEAANLLHIPSDLCRQTDLLSAAARTGRPVSIEKGPFLAPWDAVHILEKVSSVGNWNVMLTECGSSFGYDRRVVDFAGFAVMREAGFPLLFDASRSLETPNLDARSGSGLVGSLAEAALAVGVDGISLVVHDGASGEVPGVASSSIEDLPRRLQRLKEIERVVRAT